MTRADDLTSGVYDARRASQLSGVPLSTLHHWAKHDVVSPSISLVRPKLWSYADLIALRIVSWLRHKKTRASDDERQWPAASMREVRHALAEVQKRGLDLWSMDDAGDGRCALLVDASGKVIVRTQRELLHAPQQPLLADGTMANLLAEFAPGQIGEHLAPDLVAPRPHIRIVPGKVSGEPHVADTRLTTPTLAALQRRGLTKKTISDLYPRIPLVAIDEAIDLESALAA